MLLTNERARALTKDELTARLLALVLAAVLAWYTFVSVPVYAQAATRGAHTPDDGGLDGEVRLTPSGAEGENVAIDSADELDWPEYICLD